MKLSFLTILLLQVSTFLFAQTPPAFPGAEGFGAAATGGRDGQVIYVTNLNCSGTGSLNDALAIPGPKYILFKVSGIIPCAAEILEGNCYLAGQTSPGGIIVRGIIADDYYTPDAHPDNLIIRHLRSRGVATHPPTGYSTDPIIISGVQNIIVDHCTFSNSEDEAVDLSRSSDLTIQNCLLAETLGSHADLGGMLINYSSPGQVLDRLSIHHNCWNRIGGRMPEFSCEDPTGCIGHTVEAELSNNLFFDQQIQTWYNADAELATTNIEPYFLHLNVVGNLSFSRQAYGGPMFAIDFLNLPQNQLFVSGNHMNLYPGLSDYDLFYCCNDFSDSANHPNTDPGVAVHMAQPHNFPPVSYLGSTAAIMPYMVQNVGAFPRFQHETRLMQAVQTAQIPNVPVDVAVADDVLTLPFSTPPAPPTDSDFDGMPDYWETAHGLNPNAPSANGTGLSFDITGVAGYTNLECYLNCLAESLVSGNSTAVCGISTNSNAPPPLLEQLLLQPNPASETIQIWLPEHGTLPAVVDVFDWTGRLCSSGKIFSGEKIDVKHLPAGGYFMLVKMEKGVVWGRFWKI